MTTIQKVGRYDLNRFVTADQIIEDANLNGVNLNDGFLTQAGLAAYYGSLHARALGQLGEYKMLRDAVKAKVAKSYRDNSANSQSKLTENALSEKVDCDPRVIEILRAYNMAIEIEAELKSMCDAIRQRKDSLVQLGVTEREESKGTARMKLTSGTKNRVMDLKKKLANSSS